MTAGARNRPLKCVLLYGFCSSIHSYRCGNTGCTITYTHCLNRLVHEAHILSEAYYFNYNHNKRQQPIVSLGRGQGAVMGVVKQVYTLLIWTLLLVLSLSSLSRASKPGIGMNSILRTCKFINSCVYSRSTRNHICMLVPVPYGPWELH